MWFYCVDHNDVRNKMTVKNYGQFTLGQVYVYLFTNHICEDIDVK